MNGKRRLALDAVVVTAALAGGALIGSHLSGNDSAPASRAEQSATLPEIPTDAAGHIGQAAIEATVTAESDGGGGQSIGEQAQLDLATKMALNEYVDVASGVEAHITYTDGSTGVIVNPIISRVSRYNESTGSDESYDVVMARTQGSDGSAGSVADAYRPGSDGISSLVYTDSKGNAVEKPKTILVPLITDDKYETDASGLGVEDGDHYGFKVDIGALAEQTPDYKPDISSDGRIGAATFTYTETQG